MTSPPTDLTTIPAAAAEAGIHRNTLRRWIAAGRVAEYRRGAREVRVSQAEVARAATFTVTGRPLVELDSDPAA